jgi:hypothetical protein
MLLVGHSYFFSSRVSPQPDSQKTPQKIKSAETAIRKTTATDNGASDMNTNSHGSPEEERRGWERKEDRVSELKRRGGGAAVRSLKQGIIGSRGERWPTTGGLRSRSRVRGETARALSERG